MYDNVIWAADRFIHRGFDSDLYDHMLMFVDFQCDHMRIMGLYPDYQMENALSAQFWALRYQQGQKPESLATALGYVPLEGKHFFVKNEM